jgi:hypothetical protein
MSVYSIENIKNNSTNIKNLMEDLLTEASQKGNNTYENIDHWLNDKINDDDDDDDNYNNLRLNNFCDYIYDSDNIDNIKIIYEKIYDFITEVDEYYDINYTDDLCNDLLVLTHWTLITSELSDLKKNIDIVIDNSSPNNEIIRSFNIEP